LSSLLENNFLTKVPKLVEKIGALHYKTDYNCQSS
jgi:hypothetical protein